MRGRSCEAERDESGGEAGGGEREKRGGGDKPGLAPGEGERVGAFQQIVRGGGDEDGGGVDGESGLALRALRDGKDERVDIGDAGKSGEREQAFLAEFRARPADGDGERDEEQREDERRLEFRAGPRAAVMSPSRSAPAPFSRQ